MISSFDEPVGATQLVKAIFLEEAIAKRSQPNYQFYRWYYGPYSKEITKDLEALVEYGDIVKERKGDALVYKSKKHDKEFKEIATVVSLNTRKSLKPFLEKLYSVFGIHKLNMGEIIKFDSTQKDKAIDFMKQISPK